MCHIHHDSYGLNYRVAWALYQRWHLESMSPCPITPWVLRIYIVNFMTRPTGVDDSAIGGQGNAIARDVCADSSPMPRPRATAASARQGGGHRSALSTSTVLYIPSARQAPRPRRNRGQVALFPRVSGPARRPASLVLWAARRPPRLVAPCRFSLSCGGTRVRAYIDILVYMYIHTSVRILRARLQYILVDC